ncbi:hypothetical protein M3Y97_01110100 [Aphelenchoides bicaudatus]|nr:hypothetical protein M3Y97_01110100 [Aphelenchoides bicaudatus]
MADELPNTGYTTEWILKTLGENNSKFLTALGKNKICNVTAVDISNGKGMLSRVFRIVIEFSNSTSYSFILKAPTMDCLDKEMKNMNMDEESLESFKRLFESAHNRECEAYNLIKSVPNFPKAEVYHVEYQSEAQPGALFLEDLTGKATPLGRFRSVTTQQYLNVAKHFGVFQAYMNSVDGWRGKFVENIHTNEEALQEFPKFMRQLAEKRPGLKERIERLLSADYTSLTIYALKTLPTKYNTTVLCHGDAWANNMMFKTAGDGSITDEILAVIDWQLICEASPCLDLARFITVCADAEVRREVEQKAVDLLYDTFCEECEKVGKKVEYTREQAHELYDYAFLTQICATLGVAFFISITNLEKVPDSVHKAQCEKLSLRAELGLEEAFELMDKYNIVERFPKKN